MSENSSGNEAAGQTKAVLAYDLGTGGVKAALVTEDGALRDSEFVAYPTHYPEPGRHEQDPQDWWDAIASASRAILARSSDGVALQAISLSGQSLALVPVDASLNPLTNRSPIWSDSRASEIAEEYFSRVDPREWYLRTGNGFPAELYTIFEYSWYAAHEPAAVDNARWLLGSKDWINAKLTGEVATDPSYASGLGAYDLTAHGYANELAEAAGIDPALLPPIVASTAIVGTVLPEAAAALGVPAGLPVVAGGVDNSCMALGAGLDADGTMYLSLGSSNWLTVATPSPVLDNTHRPYVFDHVIDGLYVSAFSTFAGGSSLNWLSELLKTPLPELLEAAALEPVGSRGLVCVPTLAGGTVAEGGSDVRGVFLGLDLGHDAGALTRAVVEGVALSLAGTAELLASHVEVPASILAVGGGARSDLLLQTLADVLDRSVVRVSGDQSSAALGAAGLAFLGTGVWSDLSGLATERAATATFTPNPANQAVLRESRATFDAAAAAARAAAPLTRAVLRAGVQAS